VVPKRIYAYLYYVVHNYITWKPIWMQVAASARH
jgi:hypothetical protein